MGYSLQRASRRGSGRGHRRGVASTCPACHGARRGTWRHDGLCDHRGEPPPVAVLGESAFTKAICLDCSIVAPMQPIILGNMCQCFCAEGLAEAGVHGKGGCFKMVSSCELFQPELRCGIFVKLLCLKVGIVNPLEKPCCVCLNNTLA